MEVIINQENKVVPEETTLQQAIEKLGILHGQGTAIAINQSVIPRNKWNSTYLKPQDNILIIKASQGG